MLGFSKRHTGTGSAGGLIGHNNTGSNLTNCYATGDANAGASGFAVGGFIGWFNGGTIANCYSTGNGYRRFI